MPHTRSTAKARIASFGIAALSVLALSSCNPDNSHSLATSPTAPLISSVDPPAKSVVIDAVGGPSQANNGFDFNGYFGGDATITLPLGWQVTVECKNIGILHHNCAIVNTDTSSPLGGRIQFNAVSNTDPTAGLQPNTSATFTFTASRAGNYRLACVIPGHEDEGMWINLVISPNATLPTFSKVGK